MIESITTNPPEFQNANSDDLTGFPRARAKPEFGRSKRLFDLAILFLALPVLAPLMALISLYIKIVSPGPVFYRQVRVGFREKPFNYLKFRTMKANAESDDRDLNIKKLMESNGPKVKLDGCVGPRLIPCAKWLRCSGLDELPQFINVLNGDMSIVGPRPCPDYEFENYLAWQRERFACQPGLTGLWQVNGKNDTTFNEMVQLDIRYAQTWSVGLDVRIMLRTICVLFKQRKR